MIESYLTKKNKAIFSKFYIAREEKIIFRLAEFISLNIYRQGYAETFLLYFALLFNKV
jgi:hypothetical protein